MTITNQNKDKEQLNLETFQKCVSETETKFSYIDGQKENFVRTLADHCNKMEYLWKKPESLSKKNIIIMMN